MLVGSGATMASKKNAFERNTERNDVGAMLQLASGVLVVQILAAIAVLLASINIFGGFAVTRRMLAMFSKGEAR